MSDRASSVPPPDRAPAVGLQEAHARLLEVEQHFDLLQHTVDGWSAWPVLRFEASLLVSNVSFSRGAAPRRGSRLAAAAVDFPRLLRLKRARHLVKTYTSGLQDSIDGRFADIWFDDVMVAAG